MLKNKSFFLSGLLCKQEQEQSMVNKIQKISIVSSDSHVYDVLFITEQKER